MNPFHFGTWNKRALNKSPKQDQSISQAGSLIRSHAHEQLKGALQGLS